MSAEVERELAEEVEAAHRAASFRLVLANTQATAKRTGLRYGIVAEVVRNRLVCTALRSEQVPHFLATHQDSVLVCTVSRDGDPTPAHDFPAFPDTPTPGAIAKKEAGND